MDWAFCPVQLAKRTEKWQNQAFTHVDPDETAISSGTASIKLTQFALGS